MSGNKCFLSLIERLHATINAVTMYILLTADIIHLQYMFKIFKTVEFLLFINLQFTTTAQNVLHLIHCTHGHV